MALCSRNLTLGIFIGTFKEYLDLKDGNFVGILGRFYNQFFISKDQRNCRFHALKAFFEDHTIQNESVNRQSGMYMLRSGQIDLMPTPIILGHEDEHREASKVIYSTTFQTGQYLTPASSKNLDLSYFMLSNKHLVTILLLSYLLIIVVVTILPALIRPNYSSLKSLKFILFRVLFVDQDRLSAKLAMILLAFNVFLFIMSNFLTADLCYEKAVVPTNELIDSRAKLMESPKILTIGSADEQMLTMAPEGSFLSKLSKKSTFVIRAVWSREEKEEFYNKKGITAYAFFTGSIGLAYTMGTLAPFASLNDMVAFHKPFSYYERPEVFYMRRSLDADNKRFIHRIVERIFESGLMLELYDNMVAALLSFIKRYVKVYESQEDYVTELSANVSPNVRLVNVKNLFISFFGSLTVVLFGFVLHRQIWSRKSRNRRRPLKASNPRRKAFQNQVQNVIQLNAFQYRAPKGRNETQNEARPCFKAGTTKRLPSAPN